MKKAILISIAIVLLACNQTAKSQPTQDTLSRTIHVFVALCDNKYQEIVPVPAKIGNGQDPNNNLYWGCGYGIRTYFKKSKEWKLIRTQKIDNKTIGIAGNSQLVAYIGHDGLMDFQLTETFRNTDKKQRDVIILACYSKRFFAPHLKTANVNPLVWTSGLMCPEAYTVHDAIVGYVNGESSENIRKRAALAYSAYQK